MREQTHEHLARLRDAAARALTEDDVRQIFQNLAERAKKGDREAIKLVMAYLTPAPEPATKQVHVLRVQGRKRERAGRVLEHRDEKKEDKP